MLRQLNLDGCQRLGHGIKLLLLRNEMLRDPRHLRKLALMNVYLLRELLNVRLHLLSTIVTQWKHQLIQLYLL